MANLKVTITENLSLNGVEQGGSYQNTISGINDLYKRIVTVPSGSDTTLVSFKSKTGVADGAMDVDNVKYIRISNLSLQVDEGADDSIADSSSTLLLEGGKTFMMGSTSASIALDDDSSNIVTSLKHLESIIADSISSNVQLELFIASTN